MRSTKIYAGNQEIVLGPRIGKGGEGEVFAVVGSSDRAAKLYTTHDLRAREEKVEAMVALGLAQKTALVAFPCAVLRARSGAFVGFLMSLVAAHRPLHDIYSPGSRKHNFPQADFRFLVRTATNTARAVAAVHASGCVIGDINHSSVLVSRQATVSLIDADSFQIQSGTRVLLCKVGVPEYTPPELQGLPLHSTVRTANHDNFGLAVVVFQLLFMGRHPFIGTVRHGELPPLNEAIRDYRFVYTENRNVGMDQPPGTPVLSDFSTEVAEAFERAFGRESALTRPTAESWVRILKSLEDSLVQCKTEPLHYFGSAASDCPWCEMESRLGTILFLPQVRPGATISAAIDPGVTAFNVESIWAQIQSLKFPACEQLLPVLPTICVLPSDEAKSRHKWTQRIRWLRVIAFALALGFLFAAPQLWVFWLGFGLYGIFGHEVGRQPDKSAEIARYVSAEQRWRAAIDAWRKNTGVADVEVTFAAISKAVESYRGLSREYAEKLDGYKRERRIKQLESFLDGFEIRNTRLKGIGPAKQATLASYGIETAADVSHQKILGVPGFGEALAAVLVDWRRKLEGRFTYQEQTNETDRQEIARIASSIQVRASTLRTTILAGKGKLVAIHARVVSCRSSGDASIERIYRERAQAKCDLAFLGIPLPNVPSPAAVARPVPPAHAAATASTGGPVFRPTTQTPSCPRCGSTMIRRIARRGRNAGGAFWGCSRYPSCRGTRST